MQWQVEDPRVIDLGKDLDLHRDFCEQFIISRCDSVVLFSSGLDLSVFFFHILWENYKPKYLCVCVCLRTLGCLMISV